MTLRYDPFQVPLSAPVRNSTLVPSSFLNRQVHVDCSDLASPGTQGSLGTSSPEWPPNDRDRFAPPQHWSPDPAIPALSHAL